MIRVLFHILTLMAIPLSVYGQVTFGDLDISQSDELLFSATTEAPQYGAYRTAFRTSIPGGAIEQLTFFPERMIFLSGTGQLQVQNRFGVFRTVAEPLPGEESSPPVATGFTPVNGFPAFVNRDEIKTGKTYGISASPDGRFLSYLVPTSPAVGDLRIFDVRREVEITVSRGVELTIDEAPLKWSRDSMFLVYQRRGEVFYFSIRQYLEERILAEGMRRIGDGTVHSVAWSGENTLLFVSGSVVYRILGAEFFTRSLYQDLLRTGSIAGKLPYRFDPNFDRFWISPDGEKILVSRDQRNVNVLFLQADDYTSTGETISLPFLYLPRNTRVRDVLWSESDLITIRTNSIRFGVSVPEIYRLNLRDPVARSRFTRTNDREVRGIQMSPDGQQALLWTSDEVRVLDYRTWIVSHRFEHPEPLHALWESPTSLYVAGSQIIESVDIRSRSGGPRRHILALSQIDQGGFHQERDAVVVRQGSQAYELEETRWRQLPSFEPRPTSISGATVRVYLEPLSRGSYSNMVMVRRVAGFGTEPLFPRPRQAFDPFPEQDEPVDMTNFTHGSRIRRREVSFTFNAINSVSGLTEILNTLAEYEIRATFFLNGDFITRHPGAVREIADSGHEVGNLFFTYFDFADGRFQITEDFIRQGLGRNEDLYFETTGRELSLLWHAPWYFTSPDIIAASRQLNYSYIGRDVDSMDWVPQRDAQGISRLYRPTTRIIEDILEQKQPGSIIAMTVGRPGDDRPDGGREDYLFHRLDVLINGFIERGYSIVPVSTLMENAQ